jgi:hypothetical protein
VLLWFQSNSGSSAVAIIVPDLRVAITIKRSLVGFYQADLGYSDWRDQQNSAGQMVGNHGGLADWHVSDAL